VRPFTSLRLAVLLFSGWLALPSTLPAQQAPPQPAKTLTPEQKALQQQWQIWFARHQALQAQAKQVYDAEMARAKAADCPNATTTFDFNVCYGRQTKITAGNLKAFEDIVRQLLVSPPHLADQPPSPSAQTDEQRLADFNHIEQAWQQYRDIACRAGYRQFDGGTGGPSFQSECELKFDRDHLRELDFLYGMVLHL